MKSIVEPLYREKPSGTLYHYTSLDAIQSIIDEDGLWATDIHYLNDSTELGHTAALLSGEIRSRQAAQIGDRAVLDQLLQWVNDRVANGHTLFVVSLTPNGNLLSQWRSYCTYGKGLSLGVASDHLLGCAADQTYAVARCVYDTAEQLRLVRAIVDAIEALALSRGPAPPARAHPTQAYYPVFAECEDEILRVAAIFKNPAFREEAEWRAVSPVVTDYINAEISYRPGRSTLIPYKVFRLKRTPSIRIELERVFVGPTPNINLSMRSLGQLMSRNELHPTIENSQVPYQPT